MRDIVAQLEQTYCGHVGVQYMHTTSTEQKRWIQQRLETVLSKAAYSADQKLEILDRLLHSGRFRALFAYQLRWAKTFFIEGGESLIPMLNALIQHAGKLRARNGNRHGAPWTFERAG